MKKKIFAILMVTLLAISLVGCGGSTKKSEEEKKQAEEPKYAEDIVGYDDGKLVITATKIKKDEDGGLTINITAENKTDSEEFYLYTSEGFLNNYYHVATKISPFAVKPGETAKEKINISSDEIAKYEIKDISKIDLRMSLKFMSTDYVQCSFLTYGKEMDIEKPAAPKGQCCFDNEYCSVYVQRVENENGVTLIFDTRNKSNDIISVGKTLTLDDPLNWQPPEIDEAGNYDMKSIKIIGQEAQVTLMMDETLNPGAICLRTYNCIGIIQHFHPMSVPEIEESKDVDLSTIYVKLSIAKPNTPGEFINESFAITK